MHALFREQPGIDLHEWGARNAGQAKVIPIGYNSSHTRFAIKKVDGARTDGTAWEKAGYEGCIEPAARLAVPTQVAASMFCRLPLESSPLDAGCEERRFALIMRNRGRLALDAELFERDALSRQKRHELVSSV